MQFSPRPFVQLSQGCSISCPRKHRTDEEARRRAAKRDRRPEQAEAQHNRRTAQQHTRHREADRFRDLHQALLPLAKPDDLVPPFAELALPRRPVV